MQRDIKTDINAYLTYIKMSNDKHILVEGESDQEMINKLIERLTEKFDKELPKIINIDIASQFIKPTIPSVRERVEFVSDLIKDNLDENNFLGFVDREFRGFIIEPNITDLILNHNIDGLTVWSRGHSIENYLFTSTILAETFYNLSSIDNNQKIMAITLFKEVFNESLKTACAISITAFMYNKINKVTKDPFHNYIKINNVFSFELDDWAYFVKVKFGLDDEVINEIKLFYLYIYKKISLLKNDEFQWICHGHIGLRFLWDTFSKCVYSITNELSEDKRQKAVQNSRKFDTDIIFSVGTAIWSYRYRNNQEVFCDDIINFCLQ